MQLCPLRSDGIGRVGWGFFQIRNFEMLAARDGSRIWGRTAGLLAAILVLSGAPAASIRAQQPLHDPNLSSVKPQALQQLSETTDPAADHPIEPSSVSRTMCLSLPDTGHKWPLVQRPA